MRTAENDPVSDYVLGIVRDMLNMPVPSDTSPSTPLGAGGLELESLALVELTVHLERQYGVQLPDEAVDGLATATVGELAADIRSRLSSADTDALAVKASAGRADLAGLTLAEVKRLLVLSQILPDVAPDQVADDEEVVLDSLTLVWFCYQLKEQHGIDMEIAPAEVEGVTTVGGLHRSLCALSAAGNRTGDAVTEVAGR
ncbi:acyl carrier protein [Streptomyces otsuchiensis]|uniref:acyl carrier protein n=1 Tax=Streptomyces otsuchiensis TaxID=2681388 RepID=UPI0010311022|nr:acyl carrier protein [Streptomyces otsuchiensis]